MSDEKPSDIKHNKKRKRIKFFFFKLPIFLMVIIAVLIGALKLVEGYPDPLRQGFEEYLSGVSGGNAIITKLEEIKFVPNFILHAKDIGIHNRQNAAEIDLEVKEFYLNAPFSSMLFKNGKINDFTLKGLTAKQGMIAPKEINISSVGIVTKEGPDQFGSFLVAQGQYGGENLVLELKLEVQKYNYRFSMQTPFSLTLDDYKIHTNFKRKLKGIVLENTIFEKNNDVPQTGEKTYILIDKAGYQLDNPLSCLFIEQELSNCDQYLKDN